MSTINIRTKGANGEREIADDLNAIIYYIYKRFGLDYPAKPPVQRNQNQTAVGGCDLTGTFNLAVEVKRQETLSINTWWKQCVTSAEQCGRHPVLLFRQNAKPGTRTKWRCLTYANVIGHSAQTTRLLRVELEYDDFLGWFRQLASAYIQAEFPHAREQWPPPPPIANCA